MKLKDIQLRMVYFFRNRRNVIPYFSGVFFLLIIAAFLLESHLFKISVFSLLVISLVGVAVSSGNRCLPGTFKLKATDLAILSGLLFVGILIRIYRISARSLGLVEDVPIGKIFGYALNSEGPLSIVDAAAGEMQPPLDFLIEAFFLFLFGKNEWGARFHSFLFGTLSILVMYLLLKLLTRSRVLATLGSYLLLIHHLLIMWSQEGRPYSTALFFTILYLISLANYYLKNQSRASLYFVFSIQTLYLFVVGMQPPVIIVLVAIIFPIFFSQRLASRPFLSSAFASLFLYAPYFVNIFSRTCGLIKPLSEITETGRMISFLEALQIIIGDYIWVILFNSLCVLVLFLWKRYSEKDISSSDLFFVSIIILFISFINSIIVSFHMFINWDMDPRYFLAAIPMAIILLVTSLNKIEIIKKPRFSQTLKLSICFIILVLSFRSIKRIPTLYADEGASKEGWREVYSYIKRESSGKDITFAAAFFNCSPIFTWFLPGMLLHDVYMPDHGKKTAYVYSAHSEGSFYDMFVNIVSEEKKSTEKFFIYMPNPTIIEEDEYRKGLLRLKERLSNDINILGYFHEIPGDEAVIKIVVKDSVVKTLNIFFKEMEASIDVSAYTHEKTLNSRDYDLIQGCYLKPLYFILGYLGIKLKDEGQAKRYLHRLEEIDQGYLRRIYMKDYNFDRL